MKPHPRIRKTIKWGGAAVTMLLVVVWVGSGSWHFLARGNSDKAIFIGSGMIGVSARGTRNVPNHFYTFQRRPLEWGWALPTSISRSEQSDQILSFYVGWLDLGRKEFAVYFWPLPLGSLVAAAAAWRGGLRSRRRAKLNVCPKCGYDRTGLAADAKCPECGTTSAST
jgi:hypothetical protein